MQFQDSADGDKQKNARAQQAKAESDQEKILTGFIRWLVPKWDEFILLFTMHGTMDYKEFEGFVKWEWRYPGDPGQVFALLDHEHSGELALRTVLDLKRSYENNLDLLHQGLAGLKRLMIGRYGTLARCWRKVFDKEDSGKCCEKMFIKCCRDHGFTGDIKSTWAEITGGKIQRQINIEDWDPQIDALLTAFCKLLAQRHGRLREGWTAILKHGYGKTGRLTMQEWNDICRGLGFTTKDAKIMFSCIDADGSRTISQEEFLFIKKWDAQGEPEKRKEWKSVTQPRSPQIHRSVPPSTSKGATASTPRNGHDGDRFDSGSPSSAASPAGIPGGANVGPGGAFEFVVVMTKAEYGEYLKRKRAM